MASLQPVFNNVVLMATCTEYIATFIVYVYHYTFAPGSHVPSWQGFQASKSYFDCRLCIYPSWPVEGTLGAGVFVGLCICLRWCVGGSFKVGVFTVFL